MQKRMKKSGIDPEGDFADGHSRIFRVNRIKGASMSFFEKKEENRQFYLSYSAFAINGMLTLSIGSLLPFIRDARGLEYAFRGAVKRIPIQVFFENRCFIFARRLCSFIEVGLLLSD